MKNGEIGSEYEKYISVIVSSLQYFIYILQFLKNLSSRRYFVKLSEGKVYKFSSLQHREKG